MELNGFRDATAVIGVGSTGVDRDPLTNTAGLMVEAVQNAVRDAGLSRDDVDGLIVNLTLEDGSMDRLPDLVGFENLRFAHQTWAHGRLSSGCIAQAALAVHAGLASYVACVSLSFPVSGQASAETGWQYGEVNREGYGSHLEAPAYGNVAPHGAAAIAWTQYLAKYGYNDESLLGAVAVSARKWAALNPGAYFYRRPITLDDYLQSPYVVEPLRVLDCSLAGNKAFCLIVTTADRAADSPKPPAYVRGVQGSHPGRQNFVWSRNGLGMAQGDEYPYQPPDWTVYRMAGLKPSDVDIVYTLGSFTTNITMALELFGFCGEGEGLAYVQNGRLDIGGALPCNTSGGDLAEVHSFGWGAFVEAVRQLRGECGDRQVRGAVNAQYMCTDGSSVILGK